MGKTKFLKAIDFDLQKIIKSGGIIVSGTRVLVKKRNERLRENGIKYFLFFAAFKAKKSVNKKNSVKKMSKFPERDLYKNQNDEGSAMAEAKPTTRPKSSLPNK